jgi:serine/threonine protein kinase
VTGSPVCVTPQQNHIMAERNVLLKNVQHPFLVGLRYSFQTPEKLYFVLDYVNGGEVSGALGGLLWAGPSHPPAVHQALRWPPCTM